MKHLNLLKSFLLLCALVVGSSSVWADDFVKVTDASTLSDGDVIIIVNETGKSTKLYGLSTTQNNNNRGAAEITIDTYGTIKKITPSDDIQQITLKKSTVTISEVETDCWMLKVGTDQYLYASSNSSNQLKTTDASTAGDNGKATISISGGDATILFKGKNGRNQLKYNNSGSSNMFACYAPSNTTQLIVQIYKKVAPVITAAEYSTFYTPAALDFSTTGITVYTATDNETSVTLNEITSGKVPANTPVVLYKAGADGTAINVPVIAEADAISGTNDLRVSTGTDVENMYVLAKNPTIGFYPWTGTNLSAGKIYLQGKASYGARDFIGFGDGETTAINALDSRLSTLDQNTTMYNLAGQKVSNSYKGIVIVNGRKYIRK